MSGNKRRLTIGLSLFCIAAGLANWALAIVYSAIPAAFGGFFAIFSGAMGLIAVAAQPPLPSSGAGKEEVGK